MGCYVNPQGMSKEVWLGMHGVYVGLTPPVWGEMPGCLPVCLIDNGPFTAAGVAYSVRELGDFSRPDDSRLKRWYWAEIDKLREVASGLDSYLKLP